MLSRRIVTAAVGIPILAVAVWHGGIFTILAISAAAVGAWELCRMAKAWGQPPYAAVAVAGAAACAGAWWIIDLTAPVGLWIAAEDSRGTLMATSIVGIALSSLMLVRGRGAGGGGRAARAAATLWIALLVGGTMFHATTLRNGPDVGVWNGADGAVWIAFALAVTFAADTGAYFVGRAFGKRKLAPTISPNKTWEGAVGGLLSAAAVAAALGAWLLSSADPPTQVYARPAISPALIALAAGAAGAVLAVAALFGDLYISKLKRRAGFDDSGTLFPGHGGILDRMDSLMFTVTATAWMAMVF